MWLKITTNYSPNFSPQKRKKKNIKFIILHYTGMKKETLAIDKLCNPSSKVSAHYFIKKNGKILNLIPDLYEAWHAGKSRWKRFKSINRYSIGIEIHNSGHDHLLENYTSVQIKSLKKLIKKLSKNYKINLKNILGHSDIAPDRKKDPGEKFPWKNLSKNHLVHWHGLSENKLRKYRSVDINLKEKMEFKKYLYKVGYNKIKSLKKNYNEKILAKAFQRRFRQSLINGKIDKECLIIVKSLIKS